MNTHMSASLRELIIREAQEALGCSEPGMVALAAAYAAKLTGEKPLSISVTISPAVYKNGRAVGLPNTSLIGIDAAAALGAIVAKPELGLMVLGGLKDADNAEASALLCSGAVRVTASGAQKGLFAQVVVKTRNHEASALMQDCHSSVMSATLDGFSQRVRAHEAGKQNPNPLSESTFSEVVNAALALDIEGLEFVESGARKNLELALTALEGDCRESLPNLVVAYKKTMDTMGSGIEATVRLYTAAAVSARMGGTDWPVLTCAGSGNQGLLASIPLCVVWDSREAENKPLHTQKSLLRALLLSHSINLYLKSFTGEISALCGAVTGGAGVAAALCWLEGGDIDAMGKAVTTVIGGLCGMLCDGAKATCAFKISTAACEALLAGMLALNDAGIDRENGIVSESVDESARRLGRFTKTVLNLADGFLINIESA